MPGFSKDRSLSRPFIEIYVDNRLEFTTYKDLSTCPEYTANSRIEASLGDILLLGDKSVKIVVKHARQLLGGLQNTLGGLGGFNLSEKMSNMKVTEKFSSLEIFSVNFDPACLIGIHEQGSTLLFKPNQLDLNHEHYDRFNPETFSVKLNVGVEKNHAPKIEQVWTSKLKNKDLGVTICNNSEFVNIQQNYDMGENDDLDLYKNKGLGIYMLPINDAAIAVSQKGAGGDVKVAQTKNEESVQQPPKQPTKPLPQ